MKNLFVILFISLIMNKVSAQDSLSFREDISVLGRASADSISLRWAPVLFSTWKLGNTTGYTVERYTMVRNNSLLAMAESLKLTSVPLKPMPEDQWEPLVIRDKYAAIAAQALYGERFEIDFQQSDVFQIANKVKENEQRFAFALFCADMSPAVSRASGLLFTDRNVKKGDKYLYRISIYLASDTLRGSVFISPDEAAAVPKPEGLKVTFQDFQASLQWNSSRFASFTAYSIERSSDGKIFSKVSAEPLVTMSPDEKESLYEYYSDSLPDITRTYFYRVRGITPFGELSEPSDVVSGRGVVSVNEVPVISEGESSDNKSISLRWQFPEDDNKTITGFSIERSDNPKLNFTKLNSELIQPSERSFTDNAPNQVNYYKVTAQGLDGKPYSSPIYLSQLVDSIPPAPPVNIKAVVNDDGHVQLSWPANTEKDMYGYRIYRANYYEEELFQITSEPIKDTHYVDTINLKSLNDHVYYSVMAIDYNQNHSALSGKLKVILPDKVNPQPPVFLPVKSSSTGVMLEWYPSSSLDVVSYAICRKGFHEAEWFRLKILPASGDSAYHYLDTTNTGGLRNDYTVIAVDRSGLVSEPAQAVSGMRIISVRPKIGWGKPLVDRSRGKIELSWNYNQMRISAYSIYRAQEEAGMILYKTLPASLKKFTDDAMTPGYHYTYRIVAVFEDGSKSMLSESLVIDY